MLDVGRCGSHACVVRRSISIAYLLWALFGYLGLHRFYLRQPGLGAVYAFTGGLFSIGWFADAFLLPGRVDEVNRQLESLEASRLPPARIVSNPPRRD
jgi:hypothetical protein